MIRSGSKFLALILLAGCAPPSPDPAPAAPAPPEPAVPAAIGERIEVGRRQVTSFFGAPYPATFDIFVLPDRAALDAFAGRRWSMPPTECWMVAMGVGPALVLLDPAVWKTQACEHNPDDPRHVQQIVTHELVHVFHGQRCSRPEFDGMDDVGWFAEGLAILAAGQLDAGRLAQAQASAAAGLPGRLADAWSGPARYAVAGSLVASIDQARGRATLVSLLSATTNAEVLSTLGTTEEQLLADWRAWVATAPPPG